MGNNKQRQTNLKKLKKILELKSTIIETKNTLEDSKTDLRKAKERDNKLKDRVMEVIQSEEHKRLRKGEQPKGLIGFQGTSRCIIGIQGRDKDAETIFE